MKNIFVLIAFTLLSATMFSCKKDYTCHCNKVYTTSNGTVTYDDGSYTMKDNAARAAEQCNKQEYNGNDTRGAYSRLCDIR
ncbi:MAG TPA: hypothetical protein VNB90_08090 [Cytophagaceae bacterium]|nr:hypothetical protein [Cytophagaceae bacterium]